MVTDYLHSQIRSNLEIPDNEPGLNKRDVWKLKTDFINRYVLVEQDPVVYLETLALIRDSCRTERTIFASFDNEARWTAAIGLAKSFNLFIDTYHIRLESLREDNSEVTPLIP